MKGSYSISVQNNRIKYEFTIKRNITVVQGNSATGKTSLVDLIREGLENLPYSVNEIYGIHTSGKYADLKQVYHEFYNIYDDTQDVTNKEILQILDNPSDFIDSKEYFSWEQFFTKLLIQKTKSTFLKYSKRKLNKNYLEDSIKSKIINSKAFIAIKSLFENKTFLELI